MRPIYLCDIDGTIADISHRLHFIQQEKADWRGFYAACVDDKPLHEVISLIRHNHRAKEDQMRKSDELSRQDSCMNRARDDEMTFVLLGRDVAAPGAIRAWVAERVRLGKNAMTDPQILEALKCAETMMEERAGTPR